MPGFRKLLLVITEGAGCHAALRRAIELARDGASLTLLDVEEADRSAAITWTHAAAATRLINAVRKQRSARREELTAEAAAAGVTATVRIAEGIPFQTVIRMVQQGGHDLVLKAVEESLEQKRPIPGPLDRHLLRKCPVPLWLEQPRAARVLQRILVAVDPDPDVPEHRDLAVELLRTAAAMAGRHGAALHVLHAWRLPGEWHIGPFADSDPETAPLLGEALNRHAAYLDDALADAGLAGRNITKHVVHDRASRAIVAAVRELDPQLLVMGSVGRSGIPGLLIGNTAERVFGDVGCSLLTRKPAGFVSPVE